MFRWIVACALAGVASPANAARPPVVVPADPGTVLERLPRGYSMLAARPTPAAAQQQIRQLLDTAARTGDARLVARADRLLAGLPASQAASAAVLKARSSVAQYRHDFAGALDALDAAVTAYPRDGGARLARSQLHLVMGRLDLARADCAALILGVDGGRGQICTAALALRRGDTGTAIQLTDRWLQQAPPDDGLRLHVLAMRAEAAARSRATDAEAWFRRGLALAPGDVRLLVPLARHLRNTGRDRDVLALLNAAPNNETLQLQAALAAHSARLPDAPAMAAAIGHRYAQARTLGSEPELRDEAEFLLVLRGDALAALGLARRNFASQRDYEDVDILRRAAAAARRPAALAPLHEWAQAQGVALPATAGGDA